VRGSGLLSRNPEPHFIVSQILAMIHNTDPSRDQAVAPKQISARLDALKFTARDTARKFATSSASAAQTFLLAN
jgi:hypothetical protein